MAAGVDSMQLNITSLLPTLKHPAEEEHSLSGCDINSIKFAASTAIVDKP
jgi:hypothetical protein